MGCGCNNGCNGMLATMQTGDTFPVYMRFTGDGGESIISEGQNIIVAFYDRKKTLLCYGCNDDGRVAYDADKDLYVMTVTHNESLLMQGAVYVELTVTEDYGDVVHHGDKVVGVGFEKRLNNVLVPSEEEPMPIPGNNVITHEDIDNIMED